MTDVIIILDDVHNDAILIKQIANWYFTNKLVYLLRVIHPLPPIYRISRTCSINRSVGRLAQSFVQDCLTFEAPTFRTLYYIPSLTPIATHLLKYSD